MLILNKEETDLFSPCVFILDPYSSNFNKIFIHSIKN